jgi:photosystem II stability/assembly factor-like uncharacterized protein
VRRHTIPLAIALAFAAAAPAEVRLAPAPLYGADVRSLTFAPGDPDRAFAGTSAGHVYRSDDGGESWRDAGPHVPFPGWVVATLRFDPNRPQRLWAGLWGIWGGGAIAVSEDLGETWTFRDDGLPEGDQIYALEPVAGLSGRWYAASRTGVWRTDDDGGSWRRVSASEPKLIHVSSLLVDPSDPARLLAGTWRRAWRTDDGGETWRGAFEGMLLDSEVFTISTVPGRPGELWASTCGWVYRGEGFGERWSRVQEGFAERRTPSFLVLSAERLLAGTVGGLHVSIDGGRSFRRSSDPRLPILALAAHPSRPERVLIGTEGAGIWLSLDGGESATPRLVATANVRVPALVATADTVFAAVAHAGPLSGVYRSPDGGASFEPRPAELPTVLELAAARDRLFAATERGLFERAGGEWRRVAELGQARVDQLLVGVDRLLARAGGALWELADGRFRRLELAATPAIEGATLAWDRLWVRSRDGLWSRSPTGELVASSLPASDARLLGVGGDQLLVASADGLFRRAAPDGEWRRLAGPRARIVATGDPHLPLLLAEDGRLALVGRGEAAPRPLPAAFPAAAAASAVVAGGRLLVGTSGYGLWQGSLEPPAAAAGGGDVEADAADGPAQTSSSDARMRR